MRKLLPVMAILGLALSSCAASNTDEFRKRDLQGDTACIHFGSGFTDSGSVGRTNMVKAAEHGAASATEVIRSAVATDAAGKPVIIDLEAFKRACEAQGMSFK